MGYTWDNQQQGGSWSVAEGHPHLTLHLPMQCMQSRILHSDCTAVHTVVGCKVDQASFMHVNVHVPQAWMLQH